jgi:hypothetical protein
MSATHRRRVLALSLTIMWATAAAPRVVAQNPVAACHEFPILNAKFSILAGPLELIVFFGK